MRDLQQQPLRVAVIGLGRWGFSLGAIAAKTPGIAVTTCFTRNAAKRAEFAAQFNCGAESSYDDVLRRADIDGVLLTAPNDLHRELAVAAAAAGKHVFVDKPVSTLVDDAHAMIEACHRYGVKLAVGAAARFLRGHRLCRRLVAEGALGSVALVEANYSNDRGLHYTPENWQWYRTGSPGGPLMQVAIHQIDCLYDLFGPVKRVSAEFRKVKTRSEIPDVAVLWLEFESGLLGTLGTSFISPGNGTAGHAFFMNIYGDEANVYHDRFNGTRIFRKGGAGAERIDYEEFRGFDYLGEELRDFAEAVAADRPPAVTGEDGLQVLGVVHAAMRSSELRRPVELKEVLG